MCLSTTISEGFPHGQYPVLPLPRHRVDFGLADGTISELYSRVHCAADEVANTLTSRFSDSLRICKCQFSDHTLFDVESEQHMCNLEQCSIFGALDKHLCMCSRWCRAGVALLQLQSSPLAQKW